MINLLFHLIFHFFRRQPGGGCRRKKWKIKYAPYA